MSENDRPAARAQGGAGRIPVLALLLSLGVICTFQVLWALDIRDRLAATKDAADRLEKHAGDLADIRDGVKAIEDKVSETKENQDFLVDDIQKLQRRVDDVVKALEEKTGKSVGGPEQPPQLDWTEPELFAAAKKSAADYGIELTADEVRVPSHFVLREGPLDYFAVLKGGKEYESVIALWGNTPPKERRPRDFGARLNNAIQALGFKRGKPMHMTAKGPVPASGETVYLFIEWEEAGAKALARAEDLLWDYAQGASMPQGKWIYVGSLFVEGDTPGEPAFAADITAEAVASYSSPATIIDNVSRLAGDNRAYLVATPRLPKDVTDCTLIIRRTDREPTRTFPALPKPREATEKKDDEKKPDDGGSGGKDR